MVPRSAVEDMVAKALRTWPKPAWPAPFIVAAVAMLGVGG